jgi:hypothetical protein
VVFAASFRDGMWSVIGAHTSSAGPAQLGELLALAAVVAFGLVWAVESGLTHLRHA